MGPPKIGALDKDFRLQLRSCKRIQKKADSAIREVAQFAEKLNRSIRFQLSLYNVYPDNELLTEVIAIDSWLKRFSITKFGQLTDFLLPRVQQAESAQEPNPPDQPTVVLSFGATPGTSISWPSNQEASLVPTDYAAAAATAQQHNVWYGPSMSSPSEINASRNQL
jgi:hypothetical protein